LLFPKGSNMVIIFFPWFLQIWWHAPPWVTLQFLLHIFDEPAQSWFGFGEPQAADSQ
jgi:hypothetical protein